MTRARLGVLAGLLATVLIVATLAWLWFRSLVPETYSVMEMGYVDLGGGPATGAHHQPTGEARSGADQVSVADLTGPRQGRPDVAVDLVVRQQPVRLASGRVVHEGYTVNGRSPGPAITARVGDLVEVRVRNADVAAGVAMHWHGVDVPNAEDGVAGVTQDAIGVGEDRVYRFVAPDAGTYWYHSHQVSHEQVLGGLLGPFVVLGPDRPAHDVDVTALAHTYAGTRTLDGQEGEVTIEAAAGDRVRVRVLNTDNGSVEVWADTGYRVLATDGYDVNEPGPVTGQHVSVPAGGRADLEVVVPASGPARVQVGGSTALVLGPAGASAPPRPQRPDDRLDLTSYGVRTDLRFDVSDPDRTFEYVIDRWPGFLDGRPGLWWTVNGHRWPDVPMFTVHEDDVVLMRLRNDSGETHPMHLHGHHAVVLSRDGRPATGSPWWVDSLDVGPGESYDIAFLADNPGIWMDHCHQLSHVLEGLVAHVMYDGVTTPYRVGGDAGNEPE